MPSISSNKKRPLTFSHMGLKRILHTAWEEGEMISYSRRTVLKAGAAFAGTSAMGFPSIVYGQVDKIKIGHLTPLTGFLGALGAYAQLGMRLAEEEINASGGIMGRPLEVMSEDSVNP